MAYKKRFSQELDRLFKKRTHWLRSCIGYKKPGPPPLLSKKTIERSIEDLQDIASQALANKLAKAEFEKYTSDKKSWRIKGHGIDEKRRLFEKCYKKNFQPKQSCIYIFWNKKKCIYVGRTGKGGSRPSSHFEKYWFLQAKRIVIHTITHKSQISKLECIAIHHFRPLKNKYKPAAIKWNKQCPLCKIHRNIKKELRKIFKLK